MSNLPKVERKLAAIVFTDIVGFTEITANDQSQAAELLNKQRELLKPLVKSFNGLWIKEMGDGLLMIFDTVTDAVQCSIEIQGKTKNVDNLDLRIGIHLGEILLEENDIIGDDVNIASRIEPFSATGPNDAEGKSPREPVSIAASSDNISPNKLSAKITSNCFGYLKSCIAQLSANM